MHGEMMLFAVHGHHVCAGSGADKVRKKQSESPAAPLLASRSSQADAVALGC